MLKNIREKIEGGDEISNDDTTEMATKWMELADVDGNGTIDAEEFKDMINKLDSNIDEEKINEVFSAHDQDSNGALQVETFGLALYDCLKLMKNDEGEEE